MFVTKSWCIFLLAPFLKADGNCQNLLTPLVDQPLGFTLIRYEPDETKSFASGTTRLSVYAEFRQHFSDNSNRFPVEAVDRVGLFIDPNRSVLKLTGTTDEEINLTCVSGSSVLHGKGRKSEVFLLLSQSGVVLPGTSSASIDSYIADVSSLDSTELTADEALEVLKKLTWCDPGWLSRQKKDRVSNLSSRVDAIKHLLKIDACKGSR